MAKATETSEAVRSKEGQAFGPCGDCLFWIRGEGLGSAPGIGRCHGMPPITGMWPGVPAVAKGCSLFQARA